MEKGIQKLDFKPGSVCSMLQIIDLKDSPGPSRKEFRLAARQVIVTLQDNYPEFAAKNVRFSSQSSVSFMVIYVSKVSELNA